MTCVCMLLPVSSEQFLPAAAAFSLNCLRTDMGSVRRRKKENIAVISSRVLSDNLNLPTPD